MLIVDVNILQRFADHFAQVYNYPPFVSKVCAYIHFDFKAEGVTFDELLHYFSVSKSSVSCALKYLEDAQHIKSIHKSDDRKRYFLLNENYNINKFQTMVDNLTNEVDILKEIQTFKKNIGVEHNALDEKIDVVIDIIMQNVHNLQLIINNLTQINLKNISSKHEDS